MNSSINAGEQQNNLLEEARLQSKIHAHDRKWPRLFSFLRDYTVVGYYTTKIGLESIGYPGLRAVWPSMPGCPHPDDPEHAHLREPAPSGISTQNSNT